jgi:hypothetical protein
MKPIAALLALPVAAGGLAIAAATSTGATTVPGAQVLSLAYTKGNGANDTVFLANFDGTNARRLGVGDQPLVAPSGQTVAAVLFGASGPALVVYTSGGTTQKFLDVRKETVSASSWSPDSRYLAIQVFGSAVNGKTTPSGIDVLDTATNTLRTISGGYPCGVSFAPDLPDRLVYASSPTASFCFKGRVNVFSIAADGSARKQLTTDGASLNPVYGPGIVAFDREKVRKNDAPIYQVWTMRPDGTHRVQITHTKVPSLLSGLVPLALDASGKRLLAAFQGQDTDEAFTIDLTRRVARQLKVGRSSVTSGGITRDGKTVLVDVGGFMNPPSTGNVETMPFGGGPATVLVKRAGEPSWNR